MGLGEVSRGRRGELGLASGFVFAFLVMCMGEPITFPTVTTDPNQLYPALGKHMPSSRGEQTFVHGK